MKTYSVYVHHPTEHWYLVIEDCYSNMLISEFLKKLSSKIDIDVNQLVITFGGKCVEVTKYHGWVCGDIETTLGTYHIMSESTIDTHSRLCGR